MAIWDKIIGGSFGSILTGVSDILDKTVTTKGEKLKAEAAITELVQKHQSDITAMKSEIVKAEATGNWLQRSWRPILMLSFGFIIIYEYFISKVFNLPSAGLPHEFWTLLELGIGGYVMGRSGEKIVSNLRITKKQ